MTRYFAIINGRYYNKGLNAEISNIKCPICGQKMDVVRIESEENGRYRREMGFDDGPLCHKEISIASFQIKWRCPECTAELSATAKECREITIGLDADI